MTKEKTIRQARQFYLEEGYNCAQSVMLALKKAGQEVPEALLSAATGLGSGLGGAGCVCGSLLAGIMLKPQNSRELHDEFKSKFKSTCCRVLSRNGRQTCAGFVEFVVSSLLALFVICNLIFVFSSPGLAMGENQADDKKIPAVGAKAIDFTIPDLNGRLVKLSDYRGKVVLLNFWATWCPPCQWEMPSMQQLYEKFRGRDFEMLAIAGDDSIADVKKFITEKKYTFKALWEADRKTGKSYWIRSIPTTFIIDKRGVIVQRDFGSVDWMDKGTVEKIEQLLAK